MIAGAALGAIVFIAYAPTLSSDFVRLDDYQYVVNNEMVRHAGWASLARFFAEVTSPSSVAGYYQPLTMASLMVDAWLSGPNGPSPVVFHATNVCLHAVSAILVMCVVRLAIGGFWVPILTAALFALHPAQVESVAWVSQRKTVLASVLAIGAIGCYLQHGRRVPGRWLLGSVVLYALGCLAKPTVVPLPLVLPLLDSWPLGRPVVRSLREKWPFVVIMIALGWIAWASQASSTAAMAVPNASRDGISVEVLALMCHSLILQFGNVIWPMALSPYRAIPTDLSLANPAIILTVVGTAALVVVCVATRRRAPSLFVGCSAFLILMLPALGAVRFAETCVADRFLYLPLLFLLLPLARLVRGVEVARPQRANAARVCLALYIVPFAVLMRAQQQVWRDSKTLWTHVLDSVPELPKAHYELAAVALDEGKFETAVHHAERAVAGGPQDAQYQLALGRAYVRFGEPGRAIGPLEKSIDLGLGEAAWWGHLSMAEAQLAAGDEASARQSLEEAIGSGAVAGAAYRQLADFSLRFVERFDLAAEFGLAALEHEPANAVLRWNVGCALEAIGSNAEALRQYERVLSELQGRGLMPDPQMLTAYEQLRRRVAVATSRPATTGPSTTSSPASQAVGGGPGDGT